MRQAEATLAERQGQMLSSEDQLKSIQELAAAADVQFKVTQADEKKLAAALAAAKTELETVNADLTAKQKELAAAIAAIDKHSKQQLTLTEKISGLEAVIVTLTATHANTQQGIAAAQSEQQTVQDNLLAKQKEVTAAEARIADLTEKSAGLEERLKEVSEASKKLAELNGAVTVATQSRDKLAAESQRLAKERADLDTLLPDLRGKVEHSRAELQNVKDELAAFTKDKDATLRALEQAVKQRKEAESATEALRAETTNLETVLADNRATLDAEVKSKLAEASAAETRLKSIQERVAAGESRLKELDDINDRLAAATLSLKDTEKTRVAEEKAVATLGKSQDKLRLEVASLESSIKSETLKLAELNKAVKTTESKAAEVEARLLKAQAAQQAAEKARDDADASVERSRAEEKALRKQIPTLNTELAGIQAAVAGLAKQRDETSQFVTRLNVTTDSQNKKLAELQQQIAQLEEAHKVREERVMKAQVEVDREAVRLKAAQEQTRAAEAALVDADNDLKALRAKVSASQKESRSIDEELSKRLDRVQNLKADEERLAKIVENQKLDLQGADSMLKELQGKIDEHQSKLGEYISVGGTILGLGQAVANLEARQNEITKAVRKSSEEDLAIQVKLNAAQEALNRETTRADQARRDREAAEAEFKKFSADIQQQAAALQNYEVEQKKRIAELEKRINDHAGAESRLVTQIEQTKAELVRLEDKKAEFAQAEAQIKHWQAIEERLRGQLGELEEKHEIMRRGLAADESTVIMFANDLIKRIDLIDALQERYATANGGSDVAAQLRTLRQSFEDILFQHGVSEFDIPAGTEVDVALRKRIAVIDSTPGKSKPRVVESCRSGFIYSRDEGHEVVLRKVEVRTSSQ